VDKDALADALLAPGSWDEKRKRIEALPPFTDALLELLQRAADDEDWLTFDGLLVGAWHRPSPTLTPLLTSVLDRHEPTIHNEDIIDVLAEIRDPAAVDSLERALLWEPDWDEGFQIAQKAIWALGAIATPEARQVLVDAADVGPGPVREQAADELRAMAKRSG
jgi:hypothetical protein